MKPVEITVSAHTARLPQDLCAGFLDLERWPEFTGYFILPGIKKAEFDVKTPELVGSRIRVHNTDASSHVEEIIQWDAPDRIAVKFQKFQPPLQHLASHFVETWEFRPNTAGTQITRSMAMHPKSRLARLALLFIAFLMKQAFRKQLGQM